ncbi:glycosyltransferase family 4 protein [Glaciecola sp. KUL10]|uniref:glycosyltransferase family 4 protein n=1 Tax=Glaciecola sp. (strain KUL10) TaxID=2161813 RepID=UPI000D789EB2|nr:glycosyltransferase family 4 protein [Glaciecola sp. KUL10]GBL04249.1 glycosyl transferase group 1 [Glaciecola sp. KUL10]
MNILTISSLYPNNEDPKHGIFVENRLRHLQKHFPDIQATVIAPVPWFPLKSKWFKEYAKFVDVKHAEVRHGVNIYHPRYLVIPKVGMLLTPFFMAVSLIICLAKLKRKGLQPDLIDGHYFYPDGVAIAIVAMFFKLPFTCTSRGTDINLIADMALPQKMIKWAIGRAEKSIAVCQALTDRLNELGAKQPVTLRNGVDLTFFSIIDEDKRAQARKHLNLEIGPDQYILLSVGWLIERKGHYLVIESLKYLPNAVLFIAGNGPDEYKLQASVAALGLENRVVFLGSLDQTTLRRYYQISDALVLASSREGWANVLLESMACGTPVVATNIWGTPEVVQSKTAGLLVERSSKAIAEGVKALLAEYPSRQCTREYAEQFDWYSTSKGQHTIFEAIMAQRKS